MESLSFEEIIFAVNGISLNDPPINNVSITSVSIDSRKIEIDSLYIPIKGDQFDGHTFINNAFDKGCILALTEQKLKPKGNQILIYVKNTKIALMELASYYRNKFNIPVIAITGSVGKTTTKDLIASVLSSKYKVHKTQGNFNNEIGLPLTIFGLNKTHQILIVEMGMNHFGEIHNLSMIAKPDIGVITNIGVSHIEHLVNKKGILRAKCEILDGIKEDGVLIINGDDPMLQQIMPNHTLITYGRNKNHQFYAGYIEITGKNGIHGVFHTPKSSLEITIVALGEHMIDNALAAIAVAKQLNLSDSDIIKGFKQYKPSKMRMELQAFNNELYVINDTYNASPDSMKAALKALTTMPDCKRYIAILGNMFELGEHAQDLHKEIGSYIAKMHNIDLLITVGNLAKFIQNEAIYAGMSQNKMHHFQTQEDLILQLNKLLLPQDLILVKASRRMELEKTVDEIGKVKFNE